MREIIKNIRLPIDGTDMDFRLTKLDAFSGVYLLRLLEKLPEESTPGNGLLQVITALMDRGRELGYRQLRVNEIYHYNTASRRCFEKAGFRVTEETESGVSLIWPPEQE